MIEQEIGWSNTKLVYIITMHWLVGHPKCREQLSWSRLTHLIHLYLYWSHLIHVYLSWSRIQRLIIYIPPHHEPRSGLKMWDDFSHIQCMSHFDLQWTQVKWLKFDSNFGLANLFTDNTRWQSWANSLESYHCVKCSNAKCSMFKMEMLGGRVYQCVKWGDMQNSRNDICPHSYICHKLSQVIALHLCFLNTQSILFQDVWCKCFPKIS